MIRGFTSKSRDRMRGWRASPPDIPKTGWFDIRTVLVFALLATLLPSCAGPFTTDVPLLEDRSSVDPAVLSAIDEAVESVRQEPRVGRRIGRLGQIYHANEFYELARSCYEIARELDRKDPEWPYFLGYLAAERGRLAESVTMFSESLELDPEYAPVYIRLGDTLLAQGVLVQAEELYAEFVRRFPGEAWGYSGLGRVERRRGNLDQAVSQFRRALELEPRDDRSSYMLITALRALGDAGATNQAQQHYDSLVSPARLSDERLERISKLATGVQPLLRKANRLAAEGRTDAARIAYQRVLEGMPDEYTALVNLSILEMRAGEHQRAILLLETANRVQPDAIQPRFGLALCRAALGDRQAALDELHRVIAMDPDHDGARRLKQKLQNGSESAELY